MQGDYDKQLFNNILTHAGIIFSPKLFPSSYCGIDIPGC